MCVVSLIYHSKSLSCLIWDRFEIVVCAYIYIYIYLFIYLSWEKFLKLRCRKPLTHPFTSTGNSLKQQNGFKMPRKFSELYCMVFHDLETTHGMSRFSGCFSMKVLRFSIFFKFSKLTQASTRGMGLTGSLKLPNLGNMKMSKPLICF